MHFTTIIAPLMVMGASLIDITAAYDCYNSGQSIPTGEQLYHAQRACQGYSGNRGAFQGTFLGKQRIQICVNVGNNRINMAVGNEGTTAADLKDSDCFKEFTFLAGQCGGQGGKGVNAGWFFRLDPNTGKC